MAGCVVDGSGSLLTYGDAVGEADEDLASKRLFDDE